MGREGMLNERALGREMSEVELEEEKLRFCFSMNFKKVSR